MPRSGPHLAILGAGPVGLEAAVYAARLGLPFRVYERDEVGQNLRDWGHVRLFSPFGMNSTPLGCAALQDHELPADADLITGRDHVAAYLEPLAYSSLLSPHIEANTAVVAIGRQ